MRAKTRVFKDSKGNRFVIPSYIIRPDHEDETKTEYQVSMDSSALTLSIYDLSEEKDWFEFDDDHFPHIECDMNSRSFFHGYCTVMLFDGPDFLKYKEEFEHDD